MSIHLKYYNIDAKVLYRFAKFLYFLKKYLHINLEYHNTNAKVLQCLSKYLFIQLEYYKNNAKVLHHSLNILCENAIKADKTRPGVNNSNYQTKCKIIAVNKSSVSG